MRASFAVWAIFKPAFIVWTLSPAIKGGMLRTQQAGADMSDMMREKVIQSCVLYPPPKSLTLEFFYRSRAGVIDSLYDSIMLHSYFLQPQQTMMLTAQL